MSESNKFIFKKYDANTSINRRTAIITIAKAGLFSILGARLAYLQIVDKDKYEILSDNNRITHRLLEPQRGIIYDLQGKPLAINRQRYEVVIIREETSDYIKSIENLKNILPDVNIDTEKLYSVIKKTKKFIPIKVLDDLSWDQFSRLNANIHKVDGLYPQIGFKRYYTSGQSHSHIIGYTAPLDKKEKDTNTLADLSSAKSGKLGIEKAKDVSLRGKLGNKNVEVNANGREIRELDRYESIQGENIQITIDSDLQDYCYKSLNDQSGCVAVTNIKTGEFYALVSSPSYDPNLFSKSISSEKWNSLTDNIFKPLINKSISSQYPPGSTIKPFVALAALENGVSEKREVYCNGKHEIKDTSRESGIKTFHCWKEEGHGNVNMNEALKVSCDVYFYQISREVGINKIAEVCKRFGFGQNVFDSFYEEKKGIVPSKNWKLESIGTPWMVGETLSAGIGQGYFLTTSAQLSLALAQLINGGEKLNPTIVLDKDKDNQKSQKISLNPKHLAIIKKGLEDATNTQGGTSFRSRITGNLKMAGKTGTSQVRVISSQEREEGLKKNNELPWEKRDHGLFIGYGPINNPQYAVSVIIEHGGSGSGAAAPVASKIFKYLFDHNLNLKSKSVSNV